MTLRYDFTCYSPGARTLLDFDEADMAHPEFDAAEGTRRLIEEIDRTRVEGERAAPARIARTTMTREEADRIAAVLAAIAADLRADREHLRTCRAHFVAGKPWETLPDIPDYPAIAAPFSAGGRPISWEEKIHVLRREIHFRRKYDADRVARGRITAAAAREQLERLEAVHYRYWWHMFTWSSPTGAAVGTDEWRAQVRQHDALFQAAAAAPAADQVEPENAEAML